MIIDHTDSCMNVLFMLWKAIDHVWKLLIIAMNRHWSCMITYIFMSSWTLSWPLGRAGRRKQLFLTPLALPRDELLTAGGCKKPQNNTSQLNTRTSRPKLYPCWTHELFQHSKEPGNLTCYFCRILREHFLLDIHQPHVKCDPLYHIVQLSHEPPPPPPTSSISPNIPLLPLNVSIYVRGGEWVDQLTADKPHFILISHWHSMFSR